MRYDIFGEKMDLEEQVETVRSAIAEFRTTGLKESQLKREISILASEILSSARISSEMKIEVSNWLMGNYTKPVVARIKAKEAKSRGRSRPSNLSQQKSRRTPSPSNSMAPSLPDDSIRVRRDEMSFTRKTAPTARTRPNALPARRAIVPPPAKSQDETVPTRVPQYARRFGNSTASIAFAMKLDACVAAIAHLISEERTATGHASNRQDLITRINELRKESQLMRGYTHDLANRELDDAENRLHHARALLRRPYSPVPHDIGWENPRQVYSGGLPTMGKGHR